MKQITCVFLLLVCLAVSASASNSKFASKVTNLLSMKTSAEGAVQDALQLLEDLVDSNNNEQAQADALNVTQETNGLQAIADYTAVRDVNQEQLDSAQANLADLQQQLQDQQDLLAWIAQRFNTLETQRETYSQERCQSNFVFVKSIKEHNDAIAIIEFLKQDLAGYTSSGSVSLSQIQEFGKKLQAYSHLFEQQQLQDFLQLGREAYQDNEQAGLALDNFGSDVEGRGIAGGKLGDTLIEKLNQLQQHLKDSLQNLETNEIQANYDFAQWLDHVQEEEAKLTQQQADAEDEVASLTISIQIAEEQVAQAEDALAQAEAALQAQIDDLNAKRQAYADLSARIADENALLDEVIAIFKEKILSMSDYLSSRVDDFVPDQTFDQTAVPYQGFEAPAPSFVE